MIHHRALDTRTKQIAREQQQAARIFRPRRAEGIDTRRELGSVDRLAGLKFLLVHAVDIVEVQERQVRYAHLCFKLGLLSLGSGAEVRMDARSGCLVEFASRARRE